MRTATHKYSLRPNAKGRWGHQSADDPDTQVEGLSDSTSLSASTSTSVCSTGERHDLTDQSDVADPGPASLYTPKAAHNTPVPAQGLEQRRTEDQQRSHGITPASTASNTTYHQSTTRRQTETWEEIQAGRKREEARCCAEAARIRREQIVRGFEEEIRRLRARIVALRHECEVRVTQVQREWEQARAIERGEVAMVEEDGEVRVNADTDSEMEDASDDYASTQASLVAENDNDNKQWQYQQWPSPH